MANEGVTKAIVVTAPVNSATKHGSTLRLALQNSDGTVASTIKKQPAQADTTAADLAALKVDFNALLLKLRNAGILTP
jgi:hypothetical protein